VRGARVGQWALSVAIGLWVTALLAAPGWLFPAGGFICHQRPERSFIVNGNQMAVCARCAGLYAGAALAVPLALLIASPLASHRARRLVVVAALPTAVTWTLEFAGLAHFSNLARFIGALPLGFVASWLVLGIMTER
jgi:uncharacterized membrane protein